MAVGSALCTKTGGHTVLGHSAHKIKVPSFVRLLLCTELNGCTKKEHTVFEECRLSAAQPSYADGTTANFVKTNNGEHRKQVCNCKAVRQLVTVYFRLPFRYVLKLQCSKLVARSAMDRYRFVQK